MERKCTVGRLGKGTMERKCTVGRLGVGGGGGGGGGGRGLSFSLKTFLVFQLEIIYEFRIFFLAPFYINTEGLF